MHSAVRVQGQRLYDLARQGVEVVREPRAIRIDSLEMVEFSGEKLVISVKCSKGTYMRTLAEIDRRAAGVRRLPAASCAGRPPAGFKVEESATPEALAGDGHRGRAIPAAAAWTCWCESLPRTDLGEREAWSIRNGQVLQADPGWPEGERALYGPAGALVGVGQVAGGQLDGRPAAAPPGRPG